MNPPSNVISLPQDHNWTRIAKKYVHYLLSADPTVACCYLEHELCVLKLSFPPKGLQLAIRREQQKQGFKGQILFHPER